MSPTLGDTNSAAGMSASLPAAMELHPERLARQLLSRYPTLTAPLPIAMLAAKEGAHIRYGCILAHGGLNRTAAGYVISINDTLNLYRKRFTIAHELGHLLLDRDYCGSSSSSPHACMVPEMPTRHTDAFFDEERFCDLFASALLVPESSCADLCDWTRLSVPALIRRARTLRVSPITLAWRVVTLAPYESAGILLFRRMGKPTQPDDVKLRLDWGYFPNASGSQRRGLYLPRYDKVPDDSPIHDAISCRTQLYLSQVKLNFGSLRGRRSLLIAEVGRPGEDRLMAIVLPIEREDTTNDPPPGGVAPEKSAIADHEVAPIMQLTLFDLSKDGDNLGATCASSDTASEGDDGASKSVERDTSGHRIRQLRFWE